MTGLLVEPFWSPVGIGGAAGLGTPAAAGLAAGDATGLAAGNADGDAAGFAAGEGAAADGEAAGAAVGFAGAVVATAGALVGCAGADGWQAATIGTSNTPAARLDSSARAFMYRLPTKRSGYDTGTSTSFLERLHAAAQRNNSWLCVGLDPDPALLPRGVALDPFLAGIVEATCDMVCCYKPNLAFYEALGSPGYRALRGMLEVLPRDVPVLVDAKRGDTPQTMRAYARAIFDELGADAVTVNPYLGGDSLEPFFACPDRGVFVLCKTSNPGAGEIQDLLVEGSEPLFLRIARRALSWDRHGTLGLVVGATYPADVASVRRVAPRVPILLPGVGAQAGDLERSVQAAVDPSGGGALVNASRSILFASAGPDWQYAARAEAERLRGAINAARLQRATTPP